MFFSSVLFTKRGNLAKVWLAAHHQDKRLTKAIVVSTNIEECSHELAEPTVPLSLRISGQLLLGVVRIYQRKVKYLQEDTQEALTKVRMTSRPGLGALELPPSNATAAPAQITFADGVDHDFFDFAIPDIPLNRLEEMCDNDFAQQELARDADITLQEDDRFSYNLSVNQGAKQFEDAHDVLGVGEEEDIIQIEPFEDLSERMDQSIEIARDAQDMAMEDILPPVDIDIAEGPLLHDEVDSIAPVADIDMHEEPIPLLDHPDNVSNVDQDRSVLGSVDIGPELDAEINIAVKKTRKRKRPKHDRSTQMATFEVMDQNTSNLVREQAELLTEPEPELLASTFADVPDFLITPSVAIGPVAEELTTLLAEGFRKGTTDAGVEVVQQPVADIAEEDEAVQEPAETPADEQEPVDELAPSVHEEPAPFLDDEIPAVDHEEQAAVDDYEHRQFEEDFISAAPIEEPLPDLADEEEPKDGDVPQPSAFSTWSDRTKKMCVLLSERLEKPDSEVKLQSLIEGKSRSSAAVIFLETLILKTFDYIDLDQPQPYGEIGIKRASRLPTGAAMSDMIAITG